MRTVTSKAPRPRGQIHVYGENKPKISRPVMVVQRSWKPVDAWLSDVSDREETERDNMMAWDRHEAAVDL